MCWPTCNYVCSTRKERVVRTKREKQHSRVHIVFYYRKTKRNCRIRGHEHGVAEEEYWSHAFEYNVKLQQPSHSPWSDCSEVSACLLQPESHFDRRNSCWSRQAILKRNTKMLITKFTRIQNHVYNYSKSVFRNFPLVNLQKL